ncbi:MAG: hypothetical protein KME40_26510 [Komarekiella atlantica HA4396-MV6]|jgi:uncharacterized protein YpmS|nr:hypothetical protein [Komarekiella atlantica HA4396-MV6]
MAQWKQLRILLLALTLGSVLLVFMKVFLTKTTDKPKPEESRVKANIISLFKDHQPPVNSIPIPFLVNSLL